MRRAAAGLVVFIVFEFFGPLTPVALTFFTLFAAIEVVAIRTAIHQLAAQGGHAHSLSRLLPSH